MNLFKDLRDTGFYRDDYLTKECLKFYNSTRIQRQRRCDVEGGKPDVMLFTPEVYGKQEYLLNVDKDDIVACKEMCAEN